MQVETDQVFSYPLSVPEIKSFDDTLHTLTQKSPSFPHLYLKKSSGASTPFFCVWCLQNLNRLPFPLCTQPLSDAFNSVYLLLDSNLNHHGLWKEYRGPPDVRGGREGRSGREKEAEAEGRGRRDGADEDPGQDEGRQVPGGHRWTGRAAHQGAPSQVPAARVQFLPHGELFYSADLTLCWTNVF